MQEDSNIIQSDRNTRNATKARSNAVCKHAVTNHTEAQLLSLQVIEISALKTGQVMLQAGVGVGVAVCELVNVILTVETEGERHHVVPPMVGAAVVIHILGWQSLPVTKRERPHDIEMQLVCFLNEHSL